MKLLDWRQLEEIICGKKVIDFESFKQIMHNSTGNSDYGEWLLEIFKEWPEEKRRKYLKFVSGRERLPERLDFTHNVYLDDEENNPDGKLPIGETCDFNLRLPEYSSMQRMKEKLEYAIDHCIYIDQDFDVNNPDDSYNSYDS